MSLTVADIDRWSSEAVREVFHAATARARVVFDAALALESLSVFDDWAGVTAQVARYQNVRIRLELDVHGNEALTVAQAAGKAADEIDRVKTQLAKLRGDAVEIGMEVNTETDQIEAVPQLRYTLERWERVLRQREELQERLDAIVAEANVIDHTLTTAITMAAGNTPIPLDPHGGRAPVQRAMPRPLPDDPKQFHDLWATLIPTEKDWLYDHDHNIGNRPGMPWEPVDHLGKDHYNRVHLSELLQQAQAAIDRTGRRVDELLGKLYMGEHSRAVTDELKALRPQLLASRNSLKDYKALQATLDRNDGVRRYLGFIDDKGHAVVAIGNPDIATRNAIFVPGASQDLATFGGSDEKALRMYDAAHVADPGQVFAVTTWMGYDRPMSIPQAASPQRAIAGADALDAFHCGLRASHVGARSIDTIIGHSYGSTLIGAAASGGHHLDVNNVIAVGSPGMVASHASDLSLAPGATVYAMTARHDPINLVTDTTLGPDPMARDFGAARLWADPGPSSDPLGITPDLSDHTNTHGSYWDPRNSALRNLGAVIAGVPAPEVVGPGGALAH